jgi:F-type H+-transporting ATPase subunit epsilon
MVETENKLIEVEIVSAEEQIFVGKARMLLISGEVGELGIAFGHSPLLTSIKPGSIQIDLPNKTEIFYVSGGMLEVQPTVATVLADTVVRGADIDEAAAIEAKERAEKLITSKKADFDYANVMIDLAKASAQLRVINELRKLR